MLRAAYVHMHMHINVGQCLNIEGHAPIGFIHRVVFFVKDNTFQCLDRLEGSPTINWDRYE